MGHPNRPTYLGCSDMLSAKCLNFDPFSFQEQLGAWRCTCTKTLPRSLIRFACHISVYYIVPTASGMTRRVGRCQSKALDPRKLVRAPQGWSYSRPSHEAPCSPTLGAPQLLQPPPAMPKPIGRSTGTPPPAKMFCYLCLTPIYKS